MLKRYDQARAAIGPCPIAEVSERALQEFVQKRRPKETQKRRRASQPPAEKIQNATGKSLRVVSVEAEPTVRTKRNRGIPTSMPSGISAWN